MRGGEAGSKAGRLQTCGCDGVDHVGSKAAPLREGSADDRGGSRSEGHGVEPDRELSGRELHLREGKVLRCEGQVLQ